MSKSYGFAYDNNFPICLTRFERKEDFSNDKGRVKGKGQSADKADISRVTSKEEIRISVTRSRRVVGKFLVFRTQIVAFSTGVC